MKSKKEIYVKGIVQDYDKSINSINKYLFSENERLNTIIDELEKINEDQLTDIFMLHLKIEKSIQYIKDYIEDYGQPIQDNEVIEIYYKRVKELLEILGGEKMACKGKKRK